MWMLNNLFGTKKDKIDKQKSEEHVKMCPKKMEKSAFQRSFGNWKIPKNLTVKQHYHKLAFY